MYKKISMLTKRSGLTTKEFVDYYENHHVPLILDLAPAPDCYKRHYVVRGDALNRREPEMDFDVVTEVGFHTREAFLAWLDALATAGSRVADDEEKFLDRSRLMSFADDERVTAA